MTKKINHKREEPKYEKVVEVKENSLGMGVTLLIFNLLLTYILMFRTCGEIETYKIILIGIFIGMCLLISIAYIGVHFSPENRKVYWRTIK